ncbi:MAG: citryl-CoA lyase [Rhodospirillales bacterium CG15_BIG_FIL_POST_REV_8_21_14_020_66_15]|nr:MAG: citryl-CoA lyase [Rhodospirillales bacterium CG15_BIG_FIL_POST_REV_8_21_14_020_66_15]
MAEKDKPTQKLATHTLTDLYFRDQNLVTEMMGKMTFTEAMIRHILGREPSPADVAIIDAVLITLMEHGMTPSAIATRLTYHSAPEALQAAVAAGLLNVGSQFVGTMENCAKLLREITSDPAGVDAASARVAKDFRENRKHLPGFGHHLHRPDDPRSPKLFEIARAQGVKGTYIDALLALSREVDAAYGKHLTINATGATAAVLSEIGIAPEIMRGFAVISRAAGLVAHIAEEQDVPTARTIWDVVDEEIPYSGNAPVERHGEDD